MIDDPHSMNSRMIEAEDICLSAADHRLYFSVGYT